MMDLLIHILGFILGVIWILGLISFFFYMFKLIFSDKDMGPLPWWVFWRH